jgi:hypothetical protein
MPDEGNVHLVEKGASRFRHRAVQTNCGRKKSSEDAKKTIGLFPLVFAPFAPFCGNK